MEREAFYLRVAEALSGCQFVEQELKLYITEAFDLVRKKLAGKMPFHFAGDQYENSSLERLIDVFAKLSDSRQLVVALKAFKEERNQLSHRAITTCIDPGGDWDEGSAAEWEPRLTAIKQEARRLQAEIHKLEGPVMARLYFDPVDPNVG